jgi:hypothetical protein
MLYIIFSLIGAVACYLPIYGKSSAEAADTTLSGMIKKTLADFLTLVYSSWSYVYLRNHRRFLRRSPQLPHHGLYCRYLRPEKNCRGTAMMS